MPGATAWLNATLTGTAGGTSILAYGGLNNSTGPSTTGANEITYSSGNRASTAWAAAASAAQSTSNSQSWNVSASTSGIGWVSFWTAATAGTYYADVVLNPTVSFGAAGTLTAATAALTISATSST
jgi:hypothetical protein